MYVVYQGPRVDMARYSAGKTSHKPANFHNFTASHPILVSSHSNVKTFQIYSASPCPISAVPREKCLHFHYSKVLEE